MADIAQITLPSGDTFNIKDAEARANSAVYKGTIGTGGTISSLPATHTVGWMYKVITAGTYAGVNCKPNDMILCITAGNTANNSHWTIIHSNNISVSFTGRDLLLTIA